MPCELGRTRPFVQRGGSHLSKRYFDPKTHKLFPPVFRNTEERCIVFTLVALELEPYKFLAPLALHVQGSDLRNRLGSEARVESVLESPSLPLAFTHQVGLTSEQDRSPSETAVSCSSSGANVPGQSRNSSKLTKSSMNSCSRLPNNSRLSDCYGSDVLVNNIPEADKPVNHISRKKRKKKGKKHKKSMPTTHAPMLETQCEESISDSSVCGRAISTDTTSSTSELNLENNTSENLSSSSLSVNDITMEDESQICTPSSGEIKESTCFFKSSAHEEGSSNHFSTSRVSIMKNSHRNISSSISVDKDNGPVVASYIDKWNIKISENCDNDVETCSSIKTVEGIYPSRHGIIFDSDTSVCSTAETKCDKDDATCTTRSSSNNHIWPKEVIGTDYYAERAENSSQASCSDEFQPVINRKRNRLSKRSPQNLNGINGFGTQNMHGLVGKDKDYSLWQRVPKNGMKEYTGEQMRVNFVSRQVGISPGASEVKEKFNTSVKRNQNGRDSVVQAQKATITASISDCNSNGNRPVGMYREHNVSTGYRESTVAEVKRTQNVYSKQGHQNPIKVSHTDITNFDWPSKAYVQQKRVGILPQLTRQQRTIVGIRSSFGSGFQNDVPMLTVNADSCQPGPCETRVIVEEDTSSEGTRSTLSITSSDVIQKTDTSSEGTCSTSSITSSDVIQKTSSPSVLTSNLLNHNPIKDLCASNKDVLGDTCLADSEDRKYMKTECEKTCEEKTELENASIPIFRKWLPVEKNDSVASDLGQMGSLTSIVNKPVLGSLNSKNEDKLLSCSPHQDPQAHLEYSGIRAASKGCLTPEVKDQCLNDFQADLDRIVQAVDDSHRLQAVSEGLRLGAGSPVAEFEKFVLSATPVLNQFSCAPCSSDQLIDDSISGHQIPNVPLECLWKWYERHGNYGMEVKADEFYSSTRSQKYHDGQCEFRAYFVPYLSAIQLFSRCRCSLCSNSSHHSKEVREDYEAVEGSNLLARSTQHQEDGELMFEYFESDQPQQRRPLFEKIKELIRGDFPSDSRQFGDPLKLECLMHDLHPASWYSVAWYPIYRIPDGNLRATFLTYYSLGNFLRTTSERPGSIAHLVSPVVGLQTYNAKGECWFQPRGSKMKESQTETAPTSDPSEILGRRIRMLEQTALVMARATVRKGNLRSVNRHPDYEFFLSRRW